MKIYDVQMGVLNELNNLRPQQMDATKILMNTKLYDRLLTDQWKNYTNKMMQYYDVFTQFGMRDEIESILDFIWKISTPYRDYLYFDPQLFSRHYKYEHGWKKLLEMMRKNR
jgi:hypothetical protein